MPEYPMVDGAAINPYDLPGEPRPSKNGDTDEDVSPAPTAEESAPVPGPGDPDATLVEVGDVGAGEIMPPDDDDEKPAKPRSKRS